MKAGEFGEARPIICEWTTKPLKMAAVDDVLICVVGATAGKLNLGADCAIGRSVAAIRPTEATTADFIYPRLKSEIARLRSGSTGTAQGVISRDMLAEIDLALPPAAEQRRIVAKLDTLTARLARARAELHRVPALTDRLRQTALDGAFLNAGGEPTSLGKLGRWGSGGTPKSSEKSYYGGSIPWLRSGDLPDGPVVHHPVTITDAGLSASAAKWIPEGAVLVAMYGATIGRLGVTTYPATTNQAVAFILPAPDVDAEWLFFLLLQRRPELISLGKGGAQPNISQQILKGLLATKPSLEEQRRRVGLLNGTFARADRLEAEAAHARALLDRLEAAILARAFRGELVPQDPDDEPAGVLLDRIRAQRAVAPKAKRGRKGRAA